MTLDDCVGDHPGEQCARADRVVVTGDAVVGVVRIAVRVEDRNDGDAELLGFPDGDLFLLRVEDEDGVGSPVEIGEALQVPRTASRTRAVSLICSFFGKLSSEPVSTMSPSSLMRLMRWCIVRKLVSMPPSQRKLT